ncbi:MAG: TonB-dependent siderophore receptor [Sphingopyxis sp.]|nr:TonB-dependent siderophore receptor [Sphingopyxis sp.]
MLGRANDGYATRRITTATRTGTDLKDIPQSVQVVPRQIIEDQQATDLTSVATNVSGIQSGGNSGNRTETFTIRGFKASAYAIDSVILNPALTNSDILRDLSYVERVEVLKGPASVLYGRGDPGGLINIVTKQPQFNTAMSLSGQIGSYGFARGEADFTGPVLDDIIAVRLIGAYQRADTFRDYLIPSRRIFVAPSMLITPGDRTRILLSGAYTDQRVQSDRGLPVLRDSNGVFQVAGPKYGFYGESWAQTETRRLELGYRIEHDASDWLTLRQISSYNRSRNEQLIANYSSVASDGRTLRRTAARLDERSNSVDLQFDAVAKFATGGINHTLVVGGQYTRGTRAPAQSRAQLASIDLFAPVYGAEPGRFAAPNNRLNQVRVWGAYIQDQIDIGRSVNILAGLRFDHSRQQNRSVGDVASVTNNRVSPRIGVVYKPSSHISLFADYTRSFMPNAGVRFGGGTFAPELGRQYEVGIKADFARNVSLTAALYDLRRQNVLTNDPANPGFQIQTGVQRARGAEVDMTGEIVAGWNIVANASYIKATIVSDQEFTPGNHLQNVPHWSGSIWSNYSIRSGALRGLGWGAGISGVSRRASDLENSMRLAGYARVDAGVHYDVAELGRVSLNVKNLFNRFYIDTPGIGAGPTLGLYPGASRTFLLGVRSSF